ncbi:unnamed protein product, partial [Linum tenue]
MENARHRGPRFQLCWHGGSRAEGGGEVFFAVPLSTFPFVYPSQLFWITFIFLLYHCCAVTFLHPMLLKLKMSKNL